MSQNSSQQRDNARRAARKRAELSLAVPLLGICLLLSPLANAFTISDDAPNTFTTMLYVFGIWAFLIICAYVLSRILISDVSDE